jgi:hypothetical protein
VADTTKEKIIVEQKNMGDILTWRGFKIKIRRVCIINGEIHYYIKLPFRKCSYAMLSPDDVATNRRAAIGKAKIA